MHARSSPTFSGAYALQLIELVRRWNVTPQALLESSGVSERELEDPRFRMPSELMSALTERARLLTGEPGIGFYLGLQKRLSMYGHLGFAAMNAGTVREWIGLMKKYMATASTALSFDLDVKDKRATMRIHEHADLGSAHDIAIFSLLVGTRQVLTTALGRNPGRVLFDIPIEKPAYFERFAHLLPDARFGHDELRIHFDARALDFPLVSPDRSALRLAQEACERQLADLGLESHTLSVRVQKLALTSERMRTVEEVARALHLSTRTLKRKLALEQTTFSELAERERHERAVQLLHMPNLALEDIATRLHYANAASFARAFRRWTGEAPAQYRTRLRSGTV
jgi:AraC-like DNA-binding protein